MTILLISYSMVIGIECELNPQGVVKMKMITIQYIHSFNAYYQNIIFQNVLNSLTLSLQPCDS